MKYIYNAKSLPPVDAATLQRLDAAAARLAGKLKKVDAQKLPLSDDAKDAVAKIQRDLAGTMKKYTHLLAWSLYPEADFQKMVLVDYGGGAGVLACLGREADFSGVVYNDIFEPCCRDARILAQALGCVADDYVCGDIHDVSAALETKREIYCALVSINVIEHIYDIEDFLHTAAGLSLAGVTMVLSTSANPMNPMVRRRHHRQHREWEYEDGPHDGCGAMDTLKAFYDVRRRIIKQSAPLISETECDALAAATRGLRKDDIEECVKRYLQTKKISVAPDHPTNTCDPLTGNWQERLLNVESVRKTLRALGFSVRVAPGYYDARSTNPVVGAAKKSAAWFLNHAISRLGAKGVCLAPCFLFHASHKAVRTTRPAMSVARQ